MIKHEIISAVDITPENLYKTHEITMKRKRRMTETSRCLRCGYYRDGYCNDLDTRVDPDYPVCSEANYNA